MRRRRVCCLSARLAGAALVGCAHYQAEPLAAGKVAADFEWRSLGDAGLRAFLETNRVSGEWPRRTWELESLTLAAFYFSPELDVARAQWGTARAGLRTAGQRPNPTVKRVAAIQRHDVYAVAVGGGVQPGHSD